MSEKKEEKEYCHNMKYCLENSADSLYNHSDGKVFFILDKYHPMHFELKYYPFCGERF